MMAHMIDGKGPYPDKAGEYCGNYHVDNPFSPPCLLHETPAQAAKREKEWLSRMRFGRPRATSEYSAEQLEADGLVGLYLKEDRPLMSFETPCDTPPELLEPAVDAEIA